jgi:hypothetical protein
MGLFCYCKCSKFGKVLNLIYLNFHAVCKKALPGAYNLEKCRAKFLLKRKNRQ